MFGLGQLQQSYFQYLGKEGNLTLGIHTQEWLSSPDTEGNRYTINQIFIGLFFIRIVFEFIKY